MIRLGTLFWLVLVSATAFAMFGVKYQVQALEDELARTNRGIAAEEHEVHVLDAEWAYLTRPETLEAMNRQFMSLAPISTRQLRTTITDIPMRPPPAPPPPAPPPAPPRAPAESAAVVAAAEPSVPPNQPDDMPAQTSAPVKAEVEPPQTKSALRAMPALLEKPAAAPPQQLAKGAPAKTARPISPRRAKSLDDLIAQIMTSR